MIIMWLKPLQCSGDKKVKAVGGEIFFAGSERANLTVGLRGLQQLCKSATNPFTEERSLQGNAFSLSRQISLYNRHLSRPSAPNTKILSNREEGKKDQPIRQISCEISDESFVLLIATLFHASYSSKRSVFKHFFSHPKNTSVLDNLPFISNATDVLYRVDKKNKQQWAKCCQFLYRANIPRQC